MARRRPHHRRGEHKKLKSNSESKEGFHFFTIISSAVIKDQRLGLPPTFVKKFGSDLSNVAVITDNCGNIWHVELKKMNGVTWFFKGWQQVIEHHSISTGHFLVFQYNGNSKFHLLIFDMSGSETSDRHFCENVDESNQGMKRRLLQNEEGNHEISGGLIDVPVRSSVSEKSQGRTRRNQATRMLEHAYPFFTITMAPTYVKRSYCILPMSFVKKHLPCDIKNMTLEGPDRQRWPIGCIVNKMPKITAGWGKFAKEHELKVGDVCIFELIEKDVFRVSIQPRN